MPTADDSHTLVPLPAADISELDRVLVFHAASNSTRATPASELATTTETVLAALGSRFSAEAGNNSAQTLGSFIIPASAVVDGGPLWVDIDLQYVTANTGGDPADRAIVIDFLTGATNDLTQGLIIAVPKDSKGWLKLKGYISFLEIDTDVLGLDGAAIDTIGVSVTKAALTGGFNAVTEQSSSVVNTTYMGGTTPLTETILRVRAVSYQGAHANVGTINVSGKCLITAE